MPSPLRFVTDLPLLSRHVTDDVTDDLEKKLGKTVFVTLSRNPRVIENRTLLQSLTLATFLLAAHSLPAATNFSTWVYPCPSGRLLSRPDFRGNRVPDSSGVEGHSGRFLVLTSR
jgi:hypothetical protein